MLGVSRAALLGTLTFARQAYGDMVMALKPVAYWHLSEATGTTIIDEKAVQNGTYEGTTQGTIEYGLNPIVESSIGASVGFDGVHTYGLIPHNTEFFELPSYTIDFGFQADTAPPVGQNVVLFSKDAGPGTAGAISIELYNDAGMLKLRAYAGGTASEAGWIGSTSGVAAVSVGTAYKVAVTLSATEGAKLYLDGSEVASAPGSTIGWQSNTAAIVIAAWSTAGLGKFDGVLDEVALFDQALSASDLLRLAQASTLARPIEATGNPIVPRMDLWLTNDDMAIPTTGTVRYATPGGSSVGGTTEGAAGDLQQTLSASSAGDTVVCLQGYYHVPNGLTFPSGSSATSPVTVMAKPGEWAVIARDSQLADIVNLQETSQNPWTLHDAGLNIWKRTVTGLGSGMVDGCFFHYGIPFMLFPYDSLTDLSRPVDSASKPDQKSGFWFWSGTFYDSGASTLYIRFDRPNWTDVGFVHGTYGAWPDDNRYHLPIQGNSTSDNPSWFSRSVSGDFKTGRPTIGQGLNPNNTRVFLTKHDTNTQPINTSSGNFIRLGSGMNSMGFANLIRGQTQLEVHRGCHWCWQTCIEGGLGNTDVTLHRVRCFTGTHRLLGSMAVMKFNNFLTAPNLELTHRSSAVRIGNGLPAMNNVMLDNCTFCGYHEFFEGADTDVDRFRMVNCSITFIYDEFSQCTQRRFTRTEIGFNYSVSSAPILFSSVENTSGTQSNMGSIWVHHNISDDRIGKACFAGSRPIAGTVGNIARFTSEKVSWKYYNNTLIQGVDPASGTGNHINPYGSSTIQDVQATPAQYLEVFNNLILAHDVKRFEQNEGGRSSVKIDSVETYANTGSPTTPNRELRDYNCYFRNTPVDPATGNKSREKFYFVNAFTSGASPQPGGNFTYVRSNVGGESPGSSVFFGSLAHDNTTGVQSGGWDGNSTDADPGVPSIDNSFPANRMNYRPQNAGVVNALASAPSGATWWTSPGWTSYGAQAVPFNMAPSAWKGALDPNGATMPVGVQNP